jgi:hypothetical protein
MIILTYLIRVSGVKPDTDLATRCFNLYQHVHIPRHFYGFSQLSSAICVPVTRIKLQTVSLCPSCYKY